MTSNKFALSLLLVFLLASLECVSAHDNGMDMNMDGAMNLASGNMLPYIHFTPGDVVWFQGWVPRSSGSMVGACIGLFLLALFDRWLAACRGLMESHWRKQAQIGISNKINASHQRQLQARTLSSSKSSLSKDLSESTSVLGLRSSLLPFMPVNDVPRGLLHTAAAALEFSFMLILMTYQAAFITSIVVGLGVGETLFGRYKPQAHIY